MCPCAGSSASSALSSRKRCASLRSRMMASTAMRFPQWVHFKGACVYGGPKHNLETE